MIIRIKNYLFAAIFISMGIWILTLRSCKNIDIIRNSIIIDSTVCEISASPDYNKIYRVKGIFEFTGDYYRITEIKTRGESRSENIAGYLYPFSGKDSSCSILVNSEYPPEELIKVYQGEREIIIALKKFSNSEFRQIVTENYRSRMNIIPLLITAANFKDGLPADSRMDKDVKPDTGYYGVISPDMEEAKSGAKGSLAFDLFFSVLIIFFGVIFLVEAVKQE